MKAKTMFLTGGVMSLVLFMLLLPYLMYSPPWGINAYYISDEYSRYLIFKDGRLEVFHTFISVDATDTYLLSEQQESWVGGYYRSSGSDIQTIKCVLDNYDLKIYGLNTENKEVTNIIYRRVINPIELYGLWYEQWRNN